MSNTDTTITAPPPAPPAPPPAQPWHTGIDAELIGHAQNKGWNINDPKEAFAASSKAARELEKHFGVPPEQLLKMPKADAKPEDIKAFWGKLGAVDAKDYDFSTIKRGDKDLDPALADALRTAMAETYTPKDKATAIAAKIIKVLDDQDTQRGTLDAAKLAEEKAKLAADWKNNHDFNLLKAMEGARRLGISPEAVKALENVVGYASVMEAMRKVGMATREDTFIERGTNTGGVPTTREGAVARKAELMTDNDWVGRYLKGGAAEKREMDAINTMIDGDA